jgi:hypothetical protein
MKKSNFIINFAAFIVAFFVCFTSCKKDPNPEPEPEPTPKTMMLPSEIVFDDNYGKLVIKFIYDRDNQIVNLNRYFSGNDIEFDSIIGTYVYNNVSQLTEIKWVAEGRYKTTQICRYTYSGNFITSTCQNGDHEPLPIAKYELQDDRMIKEYSPTFSSTGDDFKELRTFSYDALGNITEVQELFPASKKHEEIITYDNNRGVFSGVNKPNWLWWRFIDHPLWFQTVNNPSKIEFIYDNAEKNYTTTFEYLEYNSNNYPTKIRVNGKGEIEIKYIEVNAVLVECK